MKNIVRIIFLVLFVLCPEQSRAETLLSFLSYAHQNNSKLNAERASMRASKEEKREAISEFLPSAYRVYLPVMLLEKAKKNRGGFHERLGFYSEDSYDLNRFKMYQEQGVQHITLGQNWFKGLEEGSLKAANCISCLRALSQFEISFTFLNIESFSTLSRLQQFNFEYLALSAGLHEEIYAAEEL